ncbi:hypothetical protein FNU76_18925 [Chitinimonas arctica]|uniref:Uncharacterized protein n=1 Tax=Chitinimonas arctica TaxID=2594795 RepID=A0A516SJC3_9NEIS|nr:hypothetical protein [Chitinimonas arctica]QDQ28255.1 hypothetical protein FNU76_18925 [Chitinimonas arctica]
MANRDDLTKSLFNDKVQILYRGNRVFEGLYFDTSLAAQLTGAMDGAQIDLSITTNAATFLISHPILLGNAKRIIRSENGRLWIENSGLSIKAENQKRGLGTRIFARQALAAKAMGIKRIVMFASGRIESVNQMDSELAWIKFGFIANLPFDLRARVSLMGGQFSRVRTLQELVALPGGAQWWAENGHAFRMEFDTTDNSHSWSVLTAYLNRKHIVLPSL